MEIAISKESMTAIPATREYVLLVSSINIGHPDSKSQIISLLYFLALHTKVYKPKMILCSNFSLFTDIKFKQQDILWLFSPPLSISFSPFWVCRPLKAIMFSVFGTLTTDRCWQIVPAANNNNNSLKNRLDTPNFAQQTRFANFERVPEYVG